MARQNTLPAYRIYIYTLNEDKDCLVAHNDAPTNHLAKKIARHLAAILNEPVYIYSVSSLLYKGVVRPRAEHFHRSFWTRLMPLAGSFHLISPNTYHIPDSYSINGSIHAQ